MSQVNFLVGSFPVLAIVDFSAMNIFWDFISVWLFLLEEPPKVILLGKSEWVFFWISFDF